MENNDIIQAFQILKQINPNLSENIQFYDDNYDYRPNMMVKFVKNKVVTSIWLDFLKLNDWQLRILFKRHKEVHQVFFIQEVKNFYRVGWKLQKLPPKQPLKKKSL